MADPQSATCRRLSGKPPHMRYPSRHRPLPFVEIHGNPRRPVPYRYELERRYLCFPSSDCPNLPIALFCCFPAPSVTSPPIAGGRSDPARKTAPHRRTMPKGAILRYRRSLYQTVTTCSRSSSSKSMGFARILTHFFSRESERP